MKITKVWITDKIRGEHPDWKFPEKPECNVPLWDDESRIDGEECRESINCPCHQYESSLQLAKDHSIEFEDQDRVRKLLKTHLVNSAPFSDSQKSWLLKEPLFVIQGKRTDQLTEDELKWYNADKAIYEPGIYSVDLEVEMVEQMRFTPDDPWKPEAWTNYPHEKRTIYRLIERKEKKDWAKHEEAIDWYRGKEVERKENKEKCTCRFSKDGKYVYDPNCKAHPSGPMKKQKEPTYGYGINENTGRGVGEGKVTPSESQEEMRFEKDDKGYIAYYNNIPGFVGQGKTIDEAKNDLYYIIASTVRMNQSKTRK